MSYQQILIQGNLTRDAEVRQVGQSQVAKIGVAVSEKYKTRDGQIQESTEFFDVEIWDKAGVYPYLVKGQSVLIVGQQKTDKWTDQNGQNRESKRVRAQVVQLCGPRPQAQPQTAPAQAAYQRPAPAPQTPAYAQPAPAPQYQQPAPPPQYSAPAPQPQYSAPAPPPQYGPQDEGPDLPF